MYKECEAFATYYSETTTSTTISSSSTTSTSSSSSTATTRIITNDKINIIDTVSEVTAGNSDSVADGLEPQQLQRSVRTPPAFYNGCISRLLRLLELYALSNQQRVMPSIHVSSSSRSSSSSSRGGGDISTTPRVIKMLLKRLSLPLDQAGARLT
jgi:hypothetical protein